MNSDLRLSAYLDGELSPQEEEDLRQELMRNPRLQAELAALKAISAALRPDAADNDVVPQVQRALRLERQAIARRRILFIRFAPAAALIAALVWWLASMALPEPTLTSDDLYRQYSEAVFLQGSR